MSRLHDNVHYASDVVMGAATGIIIGRSVTWHGKHLYASPEPRSARHRAKVRDEVSLAPSRRLK